MRRSRDDVVRAAGRLFAERGYHGTSMRDLGRELGLHGSSLYSHVPSKEALLTDVVERGAALFDAAAAAADPTDPMGALHRLVAGHIDVVLDHRDEVRTFLDEARSLDPEHRVTILAARDRYEARFREVLVVGIGEGVFAPSLDPKITAILLLSMLNSVDRWFDDAGPMSRNELVDHIVSLVPAGTPLPSGT